MISLEVISRLILFKPTLYNKFILLNKDFHSHLIKIPSYSSTQLDFSSNQLPSFFSFSLFNSASSVKNHVRSLVIKVKNYLEFRDVLQFFPNVISLTLIDHYEYCREDGKYFYDVCSFDSKYFHNLKVVELKLTNCIDLETRAFRKKKSTDCVFANLKKVNFDLNPSGLLDRPFPNNFYKNITDTTLKNLKNVNWINLTYCESITDKGIGYLSRNLQFLTIRGNQNISSRGVCQLVKLKYLDISYVNFRNKDLKLIVLQLRKLNVLKVAYNNYITDDFLVFLSTKSKKIRTLDISNCLKLTTRGIVALKRVKKLICSGIHNLNQEDIFNELTILEKGNLQKISDDILKLRRKCVYCQNFENLSKCARCRKVEYCGKQCQLSHWKTHKKQCWNQKKDITIDIDIIDKITSHPMGIEYEGILANLDMTFRQFTKKICKDLMWNESKYRLIRLLDRGKKNDGGKISKMTLNDLGIVDRCKIEIIVPCEIRPLKFSKT